MKNKYVSNWLLQRLTALFLIPLSFWFIYMCVSFQSLTYQEILSFFQSYINYNVDVILSALMIFGGVIGAQIGVIFGSRLKAEYLRGILAILVLAVCGKIFTDLVLQPTDLFSLVIL